MTMTVSRMDLRVEIALRLVPPHEAEMILSSYEREVGQFQPERVIVSWSQSGDGRLSWPSAEVHGRRTIKRGARATVKYAEDEDGEIGHWPQYVRDAFRLARSRVLR